MTNLSEVLILLGSFIVFSGALGFARFKEPFQRFHPPTKASLLGFSFILLGETILFGLRTGHWSFYEFIGVLLLLASGPFAAHVLSRALFHQKKPD